MTIKPRDTYLVEMTPRVAEQWLNEYRYDRQRVVRRWRVLQYADEMAAGSWLPGYPLQLAVLDGKRICTDGQHRQLAVIESQTTQTFAVVELECDTPDDVARLYYKTDRNMGRTVLDMYRTTSMVDVTGLTSTQLSALAASMIVVSANFRSKAGKYRPTDDELQAEILRHADAAGCYFEAISGHARSMARALYRGAVVAVAVATFQYSVESYGANPVTEFWSGLALDDGLRQGDPRKVAGDHLRETTIKGGNSASGARAVSQEYQARWLAQCWNKWTRAETFKTDGGRGATRIADVNAPIVINGTPWDGSR